MNNAIHTKERAVALAGNVQGEGNGPVWIQIARVGQWAGHPAGPFRLTPKEFGEVVANFKATKNRRVPIDFEHASEQDPRSGSIPTLGAPAQGWIVDLDNRGNDGLWALTEWLEPARTYIREKRYRFFSPTFRFNTPDRETGKNAGCTLSSGALTNQPFLDGMMPLAASARTNTTTTETTMSTIQLDSTKVRLRAERHRAQGKAPERAYALAVQDEAREIARVLCSPPSDAMRLADDVRAGNASIVTLADKIASERGIDRDSAFAAAERMLRA